MEETLMAKNRNFRVQLRRRREGKTDYQARKAMVVSGRNRLVTRPTIKNITVQILIAKPIGDQVLASANSRELVKTYGWRAPTGNIPAAYLTGYLCGVKAKAKGISNAILDIGLNPPVKGAKVFAALSGVVDAGVDVPHSDEKIVKERMKGEHIAKYAKSLGAGSEEYNKKFSQFIENGVAPEKITEHFSTVKAEILNISKGGKPTVQAPVKAPKEAKVKAPAQKVAEKAPEVAKEEAPVAKKAPAKKPAAKKVEAPVEKAKAPAKKAVKKPAKEEAPAKEAKAAKAPKAKATKEKAPKEAPKEEKASKKGGKKA
jgi:large subunit ribosomal protein L18